MKRAALVLCLIGCGTSSKPTPAPSPPIAQQPLPAPGAEAQNPAPVVVTPKGNPRSDLISRQVLFGNPERTNVQLSPDGKRIAWLAPLSGVMNVHVAPIDKLDQAKAVTNDTKRPIRNYFWSYDKKHLLYLQDAAGDENFHVFRTNVDGGEVVDLTPYKARAQVYSLSHLVPNTIIVGTNDRDQKVFDLYAVDIPTGKRTLVYQNDDALVGFVFDRKQRLVLGMKPGPEGQSQIFQRTGAKWTLWAEVPFEDADGTGPMVLDDNGKTLYMRDTRDRETTALFAVELGSKKKRLIAEHAKTDLQGTLWHPTRSLVQAAMFNYERPEWQVLDKSIKADIDGITKLADGGEWGVNSRTLDDKTWIVSISSDVSRARYYLWNRAKKSGAFLFASQPELPSDKLAKMHPVVIKSRDGFDLLSYLTLPRAADANNDGKADKPVPMLLWVHGGPWGRDTWGYDRGVQLFANRGYAVLQVNFRSSTGLGKKLLNAGDRQWGKTMHDDLLDAVDWAVKNGVAPKDKICIGGGSYGGYATLVGLTMTPDVFACGVDIVGPSNINTLLSTIPPYWKPGVIRMKKRIGDFETPEGKAALASVSPVTHAAKIKKPLLIGQGKNDPRVKEAESEQIVAAMKKHGLPVTYALFPDEGHGFQRPENSIAFMAIAEAFLSAHLGGDYLPMTKEELQASSMEIKAGKEGIPGMP